MKIYADNAATTKLDEEAFDAMRPFLLEEYGNASQPYSFSRSPKAALRKSREIIASCINASPEEIFFTSGGTESDNWAIKGIVFSKDDNEEIITTQFEHHAILHACKAVEQCGKRVVYLPPTYDGFITPDVLKKQISEKTRLVSVMLSNNEIGTIQPIRELASIAHNYGALFHTDAVQAVGHIPIDVERLGIDLLSASAHKFNGPKGIGFLYIKKGTRIEHFMHGGAQEMNRRAGTENVAAIVGMATALRKNCDNMDRIAESITCCEKSLLAHLSASNVDFIRNGGEKRVPGNISLSFNNKNGEAILHRLDLNGIYVSTGSACDSEETQVSHVLKAIGVPENYAKGTIRISLGRENTIDQAVAIARALIKIVGKR